MKISIFSIVLDGMPYIQRHLEQFEKLDDWHWTIVEGAAMPVRDTRWCQPQQPRLSNDGTSEHLAKIESHPNVTVLRRAAWDGKVEMCNAALEQLPGGGILVQVDVDEMWTGEQLEKLADLFELNPDVDRAEFFCNYHVGPQIVTLGERSYGNKPGEWARAWRFSGRERFLTHEPPTLAVRHGKLLTREETRKHGLVFEHYAYALEKQVAYKEKYYGYTGAVEQWRKLQENTVWPVRLKDFLPWVDGKAAATKIPDGTRVNPAWHAATGRSVDIPGAPFRKLLICMSYRNEDAIQAYHVVSLIADLERAPRRDVDFVLHRRYDAEKAHPKTVQDLASKFGQAMEWKCARRDFGYPNGCNGMFIDLAERMASAPMQDQYYAWLNLEPDCIPLAPLWIDKLIGAYRAAAARGLLAVGHVRSHPTLHLNGAAIYASEFADRVPLMEKSGWAYDLLNAGRILPVAADTPYIGGIWQADNLSVRQALDYRKDRREPTVLFHGHKTPLLCYEVRRRCGLPAI